MPATILVIDVSFSFCKVKTDIRDKKTAHKSKSYLDETEIVAAEGKEKAVTGSACHQTIQALS